MSRVLASGVVLGTLAVLAGCATPVMQQRVPVATDPAGAVARHDSGQQCTTPCGFDLDRNRDHIVSLELPGYERADIVIQRQYRAADVLLSSIDSGLNARGIFGGGMLQTGLNHKAEQEASGAAYTLQPTVINVRLRPVGAAAAPAAPWPYPGGAQPSGQTAPVPPYPPSTGASYPPAPAYPSTPYPPAPANPMRLPDGSFGVDLGSERR